MQVIDEKSAIGCIGDKVINLSGIENISIA